MQHMNACMTEKDKGSKKKFEETSSCPWLGMSTLKRRTWERQQQLQSHQSSGTQLQPSSPAQTKGGNAACSTLI